MSSPFRRRPSQSTQNDDDYEEIPVQDYRRRPSDGPIVPPTVVMYNKEMLRQQRLRNTLLAAGIPPSPHSGHLSPHRSGQGHSPHSQSPNRTPNRSPYRSPNRVAQANGGGNSASTRVPVSTAWKQRSDEGGAPEDGLPVIRVTGPNRK